ncbi:MAG: hypothetical protein ACRC6D_05615 [Aeromonas sp.]
MGLGKFIKKGFKGIKHMITGKPYSRSNGAMLPPGMSSIRTPTMGDDQRRQLESIQDLLGKGAQQSIEGLLGTGQSPIDKAAISDFQRNIMPQMTQGAANNDLLGASGVAGAQADATSRLSEGLAAQKYDAVGDLLGKYGEFSKISPYKYSVYQQPTTNWGDLANTLGQGTGDGSWGDMGQLLGGSIGSFIPGLGTMAGGLIGKIGGKGLGWLFNRGKKSGGSSGGGGGGNVGGFISNKSSFGGGGGGYSDGSSWDNGIEYSGNNSWD